MKFYAIGSTLSEMAQIGSNPGSKETEEQRVERQKQEQAKKDLQESLVFPDLVSSNVVASGKNWYSFGPMFAAHAWYQAFAAAEHKVFVSDGSSTIEKLQEVPRIHFGVIPVA